MSSIIPIIVGQKIIREASRSQALQDAYEYCEEMQGIDDDESADDLFGTALFVGLFAVVFACIAVNHGGWLLWGATVVCVIMSGLLFFADYCLFKGDDEDGEGSGSER